MTTALKNVSNWTIVPPPLNWTANGHRAFFYLRFTVNLKPHCKSQNEFNELCLQIIQMLSDKEVRSGGMEELKRSLLVSFSKDSLVYKSVLKTAQQLHVKKSAKVVKESPRIHEKRLWLLELEKEAGATGILVDEGLILLMQPKDWSANGLRLRIYKKFAEQILPRCPDQVTYATVCQNLLEAISVSVYIGKGTLVGDTIRDHFEQWHPIDSQEFKILHEILDKEELTKLGQINENISHKRLHASHWDEISKRIYERFIGFLNKNTKTLKRHVFQAAQIRILPSIEAAMGSNGLDIYKLRKEFLLGNAEHPFHFDTSSFVYKALDTILIEERRKVLGKHKPESVHIDNERSYAFRIYCAIVIPDEFAEHAVLNKTCFFLQECLVRADKPTAFEVDALMKEFASIKCGENIKAALRKALEVAVNAIIIKPK